MITPLIASMFFHRVTGNPIVVPIKGFVVDPIVSLSIDGKPPEDFGLSMMTRHSIVVKSDDVGSAKQLTFDGKSLGAADLESPGNDVHPVLNALGLGVLNGMAIGIDYAKNQITFWPGGKLSEEEANAWVLKSTKWIADSHVTKARIERRSTAPVLTVSVDGKPEDLLLRVGKEGTSFAHGVEPASGTSIEYGQGGNQALLGNMGIGSTTIPWVLYFRNVMYDPRKAIDPSIVGTFTTDDLLARRVILDLPANTMYCESLPADAQLSMFLAEWFQMPIEVQGSKAYLKEMPDTRFYPQLETIYNSEILEIMGQPIDTILSAARDFTGDHRTLIKVLFEKVWQGFRVKIKRPKGDVVEITLSPPK